MEAGGKQSHLAVILLSCLAYYSTLKVEATCSSKMSVDFQQAAQHYIPEDKILHTVYCLNSSDFCCHL
jgi:hypothetical protein